MLHGTSLCTILHQSLYRHLATRRRYNSHGSNKPSWLSDLFFILPSLTIGQYCNLNHIVYSIKLLGKVGKRNKTTIYKKLFSLIFVSKRSVFLLENYFCDMFSSWQDGSGMNIIPLLASLYGCWSYNISHVVYSMKVCREMFEYVAKLNS